MTCELYTYKMCVWALHGLCVCGVCVGGGGLFVCAAGENAAGGAALRKRQGFHGLGRTAKGSLSSFCSPALSP